MDTKIIEIAKRIKGLREILGFSVEDMSDSTNVSTEEYILLENGETDFSFTFLYKCAKKLSVDIVELLTGENPKLSSYSIVRKNKGLNIKRRKGFVYEHLAYSFKDKIAQPFLVVSPYIEEEQDLPVHLSTHTGQEFNYILSGSLKVVLDKNTEILNEGDSLYYDSSKPHGMIAVGGQECRFLAIVMKNSDMLEEDV